MASLPYSKLNLAYRENFNFVQWHSDTHSDGQSDIVDYRAAYFAAKNACEEIFSGGFEFIIDNVNSELFKHHENE